MFIGQKQQKIHQHQQQLLYIRKKTKEKDSLTYKRQEILNILNLVFSRHLWYESKKHPLLS